MLLLLLLFFFFLSLIFYFIFIVILFQLVVRTILVDGVEILEKLLAEVFGFVIVRDVEKFWIFVASSVCASFAGMILAANLNNTGKYEYGNGLELSVIAAVILGGTSLFGGKGSVPGTIFGALFVQLIGNGLLLTGLESSQLDIIKGGIIVVAVALRRERKGVR